MSREYAPFIHAHDPQKDTCRETHAIQVVNVGQRHRYATAEFLPSASNGFFLLQHFLLHLIKVHLSGVALHQYSGPC